MAISIEQIDELRRRTNCSYEEAKMLLEKHNGDILEAVLDFERSNGSTFSGRYYNGRQNNGRHYNTMSFGAKIKQWIYKGAKTRFIIEKGGDTIINISLNLLIIAALFLNWILLAALVIALILGYRFTIRKEQGNDIDISKIINDFGNNVKDIAKDVKQQENPEQTKGTENNNSADDYDEITID